jgi:hypothetical protein
MRRSVAISLVTLSLLDVRSPAADDKKPAAEAHRVDVRLADGSTVRMTLTQPTLEVTTRFGKVTIPTNEIRHIDFAFRYGPGVLEKLEAAAAKLGSDDFSEREAATAELLSYQEVSFPTLEKLTKHKDKEVRRRAEEMIAALRDKLPEEKFKFRKQDTVAADAFTVVGKIEDTTLKAKSQFFGAVTLNLADLRGLRRAGAAGEKEVALDLAKYGGPQIAWLNTGVEVTREMALEIRAYGESDLYPIGAERMAYRTNPNGSRQWGVSRDQRTPGVLIGRIGERGKEFEIGEKYEGTPGVEGKLYLRVGGSPWGNIPAGEYRVKILPH